MNSLKVHKAKRQCKKPYSACMNQEEYGFSDEDRRLSYLQKSNDRTGETQADATYCTPFRISLYEVHPNTTQHTAMMV